MPILLENQTPAAARWHRGAASPELPPGEVHVWRAWLDEVWNENLDTLSMNEIIRAERRANAAERNRDLAGRVFLRDVLSRYLCIAPQDLRLDAGAPFYSSPASGTLRWTLSESENLALLALSRASNLGVGVERVHEDLPFDEMAAHFLEPEEQSGLRTTFAREQKAWKFFDFWTTSEARTKAAPMHPFQAPRPLALHRLSPAEGFLAAVAVGGAHASSRLALWDWR